MPKIDSILLATKPSLSAAIMGIPPPTLASKEMLLPCWRALLKSSEPWRARSILFAVTTSLPFSRAVMMISFAGCNPPTSSTTTWISGLFKSTFASFVKRISGDKFSLFFTSGLLSAIPFNTGIQSSFSRRGESFSRRIFATPVPTVPIPIRPTLKVFIIICIP